MQYNDFMTAITDIYGDYKSEILEQITVKYIRERFKEPELDKVMSTLLLKLNPKYKTPPSPADFEEIFFTKSAGNYEAAAVKIYNQITATGCSLDHVIIGDIRGQKALEKVFGTWPDFCRRDPDDEQWHRKNFIKAYCECEVEPDEIPRIMYGDSSNRDRIPNLYGDKDECKKYLEYSKPNAVRQLADTLTRDMRIGNEH
jgi:hypothetical protein